MSQLPLLIPLYYNGTTKEIEAMIQFDDNGFLINVPIGTELITFAHNAFGKFKAAKLCEKNIELIYNIERQLDNIFG